jgi:GTP-binding protein
MRKLPNVAIIGFPNVGKSTLFNRLLKQRKSLVHSLPGMTRDQVSSVCFLDAKKFVLVDTGGFYDSAEDPISSLVREKAEQAAEKADLVLFVLDGKRELLPAEEELYFSLKKLNKQVFVVVNKVDTLAEEAKIGDYYRLGAEKLFAISAEHKRNLESLESSLIETLPSPVTEKKEREPLRIAIVGRINVGKSSIVNCICGEPRLIVSEIPGTTRDSTDTMIFREKRAFILVDTAGIRKLVRTRDKREKASIIKANKDIAQADVVCLTMDAQEFATRQDLAIAHLSHESGKPLLIALNKWDLVEKDHRTSENFRGRVYARLDFVNYAPLLFISALTGQRVIKILEFAEQVHRNACKRVPTSQLNRFLSLVNRNYPALSKDKKRFRIKYMTQKGILPPTFALFSSSRLALSSSYQKFFTNLLREKFGFWGTPIRLLMRKG